METDKQNILTLAVLEQKKGELEKSKGGQQTILLKLLQDVLYYAENASNHVKCGFVETAFSLWNSTQDLEIKRLCLLYVTCIARTELFNKVGLTSSAKLSVLADDILLLVMSNDEIISGNGKKIVNIIIKTSRIGREAIGRSNLLMDLPTLLRCGLDWLDKIDTFFSGSSSSVLPEAPQSFTPTYNCKEDTISLASSLTSLSTLFLSSRTELDENAPKPVNKAAFTSKMFPDQYLLPAVPPTDVYFSLNKDKCKVSKLASKLLEAGGRIENEEAIYEAAGMLINSINGVLDRIREEGDESDESDESDEEEDSAEEEKGSSKESEERKEGEELDSEKRKRQTRKEILESLVKVKCTVYKLAAQIEVSQKLRRKKKAAAKARLAREGERVKAAEELLGCSSSSKATGKDTLVKDAVSGCKVLLSDMADDVYDDLRLAPWVFPEGANVTQSGNGIRTSGEEWTVIVSPEVLKSGIWHLQLVFADSPNVKSFGILSNFAVRPTRDGWIGDIQEHGCWHSFGCISDSASKRDAQKFECGQAVMCEVDLREGEGCVYFYCEGVQLPVYICGIPQLVRFAVCTYGVSQMKLLKAEQVTQLLSRSKEGLQRMNWSKVELPFKRA